MVGLGFVFFVYVVFVIIFLLSSTLFCINFYSLISCQLNYLYKIMKISYIYYVLVIYIFSFSCLYFNFYYLYYYISFSWFYSHTERVKVCIKIFDFSELFCYIS